MTDIMIEECSKVILEFLNEDSDTAFKIGSFNTPMNLKMSSVLTKWGTTMIGFIGDVNLKFKLMPEPLWGESAREFFVTGRAHQFLSEVISIVRDKKINQILE
jgi:hypothetical protein